MRWVRRSGERGCGRDYRWAAELEDCTIAVDSAVPVRSIKVAIVTLKQLAIRIAAVAAIAAGTTKSIQPGDRAVGSELI